MTSDPSIHENIGRFAFPFELPNSLSRPIVTIANSTTFPRSGIHPNDVVFGTWTGLTTRQLSMIPKVIMFK